VTTPKAEPFAAGDPDLATRDVMVPELTVAREFAVAMITLTRWDASPTMVQAGWPPRIRIGDGPKARVYRSRRQLELFKQSLIESAASRRAARMAEAPHERAPAA
jgi:hypothetical protein